LDARADAESKLEDLMRRNPARPSAEEQPAQRRYAFLRSTKTEEPPKPKPEPSKPEPSHAWQAWEAWLDGRIAASLQEDGRIGAVIAECLAQVLDDVHDEINNERNARVKFEDRCRELEIRVAQQEVALAKRDVDVARQDFAIAELQSRLATGKSGVVDLPNNMKMIN
jgi:hypothetical protein